MILSSFVTIVCKTDAERFTVVDVCKVCDWQWCFDSYFWKVEFDAVSSVTFKKLNLMLFRQSLLKSWIWTYALVTAIHRFHFNSAPVQSARFGPVNNFSDVIDDDTMCLSVVLNDEGLRVVSVHVRLHDLRRWLAEVLIDHHHNTFNKRWYW